MDGIRNNIAINDTGIHSNVIPKVLRYDKEVDGITFMRYLISFLTASQTFTYTPRTQLSRNLNSDNVNTFVYHLRVFLLADKPFNLELKVKRTATPINVDDDYKNNPNTYATLTSASSIEYAIGVYGLFNVLRAGYTTSPENPAEAGMYTNVACLINGIYVSSAVVNPITA